MKKLLMLSVIALFTAFCLQACSNEDDNQDEFLKKFNLPKGVTKVTVGWQTNENTPKYALLAGFLDGDMWFAAYNDKIEQVFEYRTPMIRGFNQKYYLEFGKVEEVNINNISLSGFIMEDNGIILLVNYGGPSEIITTFSGKEKRLYFNRYDNSVFNLRNWNDEYFITIVYNNNHIFDKKCENSKEVPLDSNIINSLIPINNFSGLRVIYPEIYLYNITTGNNIWGYQHKYYSAEFMITNKTIKINDDTIDFTFDIVYKNGDKENESFKLKLSNGSLVED